jgi:hypothetical protein
MEIKPSKSDTISFKPLTEGLGLNHFTDGMPYSPAPEAARARTALKGQRPATPPPRATIPSVNDLFAAIPAVSSAVASAAATASLPATAAWGPLAKAAPAAILATTAAVEAAAPAVPATAWRRLGAFALDVVASVGLALLVAATGFRINGFDLFALLQSRAGLAFITPMMLFVTVFSCGYFLLQEVTWRRTLGKALFGIRLESPSAFAVLGRAFCFPFAVLPLGIGLIWFAFDARKRCWHDAVTETDVVLG